MTESSTARIRELNDAFRKTFAGGKMVMSANVAALPRLLGPRGRPSENPSQNWKRRKEL